MSGVVLFVHIFITFHWNGFIIIPIAGSNDEDKSEKIRNIIIMNIARLLGLIIVDSSNFAIGLVFDIICFIIALMIVSSVASFGKKSRTYRSTYSSVSKKKCINCGKLVPSDLKICTYCEKPTNSRYGYQKCSICGTEIGKYTTKCPSCYAKIKINKQNSGSSNKDTSYKNGEQEYIEK